jgi:hypothetical protein
MANNATPQTTAGFDITAISFGNRVTYGSIKRDTAKLLGLGNEKFTKSLELGEKYQQVILWWKETGKSVFEANGHTTNWDDAVVLLTGKSRGWFNKLVRAAKAAEASPEVLAAYQAAEAEKNQSWNLERFNAYVNDDATAAPGEEAEVGDVREVDSTKGGKMLGQMRMTGCSDDVYLNKSMEVETKAEDRDVMVMLAVWKDRLAAAGLKGAASMIKVPTAVDATTGESIKDEAVQYING